MMNLPPELLQQFAQQQAGSAEPAVKIKAGKCKMERKAETSNTYVITPEKRKGQVQLVVADGVTHFQWKDRISNQVDPTCDHMIFPGDAEFVKVETGREGERVFMLQFAANSSRRFFFWLQDKESEKDEELVKALNDALNAPPNAGAEVGEGDAADPQQAMLRALLGGDAAAAAAASSGGGSPGGSPGAVAAATGAADTPAPAAAGSPGAAAAAGNLNLNDLQSAMSNIFGANPPGAAAGGPAAAPATPAGALSAEDLQRAMMGAMLGGGGGGRGGPSLGDLVQGGDIDASGVLDDEAVRAALLPTLPEGQQNVSELRATVSSPQFQQALASLSGALQNPDNYQSIFANFGLDPTAGAAALARGSAVEAFLAAIQATTDAAAAAGAGAPAPAPAPAEGKDGSN